MTNIQFDRAIADANMSANSATARACRLVLVGGLSRNAAAREVGLSPSVVTRAVSRIAPRPKCPTCGR